MVLKLNIKIQISKIEYLWSFNNKYLEGMKLKQQNLSINANEIIIKESFLTSKMYKSFAWLV